MINTEEVLDIARQYCTEEEFEVIARATVELDRLYSDTAPLSREELEDELRKAGFVNEVPPNQWEHNRWVVIFCVYGNLFISRDHDGFVTFNLPLSVVTRRLLRDCGVIQ